MVDMKNILAFMYNGETQVEQDNILPFLKLAGYLQVKGLTDGLNVEDDLLDERAPSVKKDREVVEKTPNISQELKGKDPRNELRTFEKSRANSLTRNYGEKRENPGAGRLTREDFDFISTKKSNEIADGKKDVEKINKSDFERKSEYETSKVREMRLKEAMKNSIVDGYPKKSNFIKKESLGEQMRALKAGSSGQEEIQRGNTNENMYNAIRERKRLLERIGNAPLSQFEKSLDETSCSPDFDPSLLVKTEIDESVGADHVLNPSLNEPFSHTPSAMPKTSSSDTKCHLCGKGPFAKGKISQHMKNVHSDIAYSCTTCNKTFKCERYLQNHKRQYCPERFRV